MRMMATLLAAAIALIPCASIQAQDTSTMCSNSSPRNDSGDLTFYCQRGERGLDVANVQELQDWESNESTEWYLRYASDYLENVPELCRIDLNAPINVRVNGRCSVDVQAYHPSVANGAIQNLTVEFGDQLEGGCMRGTCGWRVRVHSLHCECWTDGFIPPP